MTKDIQFEIGSVKFSAIRKTKPCLHWVFRTDENGIEYQPGTGGISTKSVPQMKSSIQELLDRVSKGDVTDFRKRMSLTAI